MGKNATQRAVEFAEAALKSLAQRIEEDYGVGAAVSVAVNIHPKGDGKQKERARVIAYDLGATAERGGPGYGFATFETPTTLDPTYVTVSVFHSGH